MTIRSDLRRAQASMAASPTQGVLACMSILGRFPGNAKAKRLLRGMDSGQRQAVLRDATRLCDAGHWMEAFQLLAPIGRARPDDPRLALAEAWCLFELGRPRDMAARLACALAVQPDHPALRAAHGSALHAMGDSERALVDLTAAAALAPRDVQIANNLGLVQASLGHLDAARRSFQKAVAQGGGLVEAWPNLAPLVDFNGTPDLLALLDGASNRADLTDRQRELVGFARAKAEFDRGEIASGLDWLHIANRLHRIAHPHDEAAERRRMTALANRLPKGLVAPAPDQDAPRVIMVVGMPRSGTTLVERILAAHPQVAGLGECRELEGLVNATDTGRNWTARQVQDLGADYRAALAARASGSPRVVVDKMPSNALVAGFALAALPDLHVVHVRRDPVATALSNYRTRFAEGNGFASDLEEIASRQRLTDEMMASWRSRFPDRVHDFVLEALIDAPQRQIGRLLERLGLPPAAACIEFDGARGTVHTASQLQVRGPIARQPSSDWRAFAPFIDPLLKALGPSMRGHDQALKATRDSLGNAGDRT